jgi:hypothetical protein
MHLECEFNAETQRTQRQAQRRPSTLEKVQDSPLGGTRIGTRSLRFLCDLCVSALKGLGVWYRLRRVRERFPDTLMHY